MIELTLNKAVEITNSLIEEFGEDYVYPPARVGAACTYVKDEAPSCLVGHILHKVGVPLGRLKVADVASYGTSEGADRLIGSLIEEGVVHLEPKAREFLVQVQANQDAGETWADSRDFTLTALR